MTVESAINVMKLLYGESNDPNNTDILSFPQGWGTDNEATVNQWISSDLMTDAHRSELMMKSSTSVYGDQLDESEQPSPSENKSSPTEIE